jgi:paraquat-inducible protein A
MPRVPSGCRAICVRCGGTLFASKPRGLDRAISLYATAFVLWVIANSFGFLTFRLQGRDQPSRLASGAIQLYQDGLWELAVLVALFVIVFPAVKILSSLAALVPLRLGRRPRSQKRLLRLVEMLHPWAMTEVFLVGVLVAYAKLIDLATLVPGPSLLAFVALMVVLAAADSATDTLEVWERVRPSPAAPLPSLAAGDRLVACHACRLVSVLAPLRPEEVPHCSRCGSQLHARKPNSLNRCWALVIAAAILYIPANLYPVMTVISFGRGEPDTILSGVKQLLLAGMWPLALLVFFASITVPVLKLFGLLGLLISVHRGSRWRPRDRALLYRVVEAVGRWSMIDIFMISILVALVRLGAIASISPGVGAISFAAVVVLTMFAAMSFDPRLIWDAAGANDDG